MSIFRTQINLLIVFCRHKFIFCAHKLTYCAYKFANVLTNKNFYAQICILSVQISLLSNQIDIIWPQITSINWILRY